MDEQRTDNDYVPKLWASEDARMLIMDDRGRMPISRSAPTIQLAPVQGEYDSERHFLLGYVDDAPRFVTVAELPTSARTADLREIGPELLDHDRDLAMAANALINWHRAEPYCSRCGTATVVRKAGYMRLCPQCGKEIFPRTDPAVIVAIVDDDDRLLLGRQATWGERVSVFAGFVEAGESLEQAVHREMTEEVGVRLRSVEYFGSQPWPFPRSLMIGFVARADSTNVTIGDEIAYADWFTRDRLDQQEADGTIALPTPMSIGNRLVTAWRAGQI